MTHDIYRIKLSSTIALKEEQIKYYNRVMYVRKLKKLFSEPYKTNQTYTGNMKRPAYIIQRRELSIQKWSDHNWRLRILKELNKRNPRSGSKWNNELLKAEIREADDKAALRMGQINGYVEEVENFMREYMNFDQ